MTVLKDKRGVNQSTEFIMHFVVAVIVALMFIEILLCTFSIFSMNVVATNVARSVSVQGGFDTTTSEDIYDLAITQLGSKAKPGTVEVTFTSEDGSETVVLTDESKTDEFKPNLGDSFSTTVTAEVPLVQTFNGRYIYITMHASSSGVGEVYYK